MRVFESTVYIQRREILKKRLGRGKVLLYGNQEVGVNFKDNWYPFRQDSTLLYYTGIDIPDVHLMIDIDQNEEVLFGNSLTIDDIVWTGPLPSLQEIAHAAGISKVSPLKKLTDVVDDTTMYLPPYRSDHTLLLSGILDIPTNEVSAKASLPLIHAVIQQRNYKDRLEIEEMNQAVAFSYDMHKAVMKASKEGIYEYDLVGVASEIAYQNHVHFAYPAILTKRGEVLHNHDHSHLISSNDIILYDGGCESHKYYAGDITRTFPVNGEWTSLQKDLYDVVYDSFSQCERSLRPGVLFKDVHLLGSKVIFEGMKSLGFAKGDVDDAVANGAHTLFFQCGLGHMIGLDVHDMENLGEHHVGYGEELKKSKEFGLKSLRLARTLEPGFALTVEPGIYIIPELIEMRKQESIFHEFINFDRLEKIADFGGIRLEDNYVITADGYTRLGDHVEMPRTSEEIEAFMKME